MLSSPRRGWNAPEFPFSHLSPPSPETEKRNSPHPPPPIFCFSLSSSEKWNSFGAENRLLAGGRSEKGREGRLRTSLPKGGRGREETKILFGYNTIPPIFKGRPPLFPPQKPTHGEHSSPQEEQATCSNLFTNTGKSNGGGGRGGWEQIPLSLSDYLWLSPGMREGGR